MGGTRRSRAERERRYREGRCFYCGERGHLANVCYGRGNQRVSEVTEITRTPRRLTTVVMRHHSKDIELGVLIDSGADESFIDWDLVRSLGIRVIPLKKPVKASALNENSLFTITHVTEPVELRIAGHWECIRLHPMHSPLHHLILDFPWLTRHTGDIVGWGRSCRDQCQEPQLQGMSSSINRVCTDSVTDSQVTDLTKVPGCYHHLAEVFSKTKTTALPPHRPFDCDIDLLPGFPHP